MTVICGSSDSVLRRTARDGEPVPDLPALTLGRQTTLNRFALSVSPGPCLIALGVPTPAPLNGGSALDFPLRCRYPFARLPPYASNSGMILPSTFVRRRRMPL